MSEKTGGHSADFKRVITSMFMGIPTEKQLQHFGFKLTQEVSSSCLSLDQKLSANQLYHVSDICHVALHDFVFNILIVRNTSGNNFMVVINNLNAK